MELNYNIFYFIFENRYEISDTVSDTSNRLLQQNIAHCSRRQR